YQIKHMGHRIELGEIEANVSSMQDIRLAGCIYDREKGKIALYYVGDIDAGQLTAALKEKLPRYMIPNFVKRLDEMPLTPNGKINRVALKERYGEERENRKRK
ncbi:MAG: amino acid adenylation domain-containing protein, partial [Lachnospiraceae bacterium]|nr:amino acid adenylation domain-containing protein [Lachnospiraceae bacterium]